MDERWKSTYDDWKTTPPDDPPEEDGCTCYDWGRQRYKRDEWCPIHGKDPDEERDKLNDLRRAP